MKTIKVWNKLNVLLLLWILVWDERMQNVNEQLIHRWLIVLVRLMNFCSLKKSLKFAEDSEERETWKVSQESHASPLKAFRIVVIGKSFNSVHCFNYNWSGLIAGFRDACFSTILQEIKIKAACKSWSINHNFPFKEKRSSNYGIMWSFLGRCDWACVWPLIGF